MSSHTALSQKHQDFFVSLLGNELVKTDSNSLLEYGRDWTRQHDVHASIVLFPKNTEAVSKIMSYCNRHKLAVIPSGGRTGLAAGAVATQGEVILSLEKMNRIEAIDEIGMIARVEAGVTCEALQMAAKERGLFFALDLASKGSCQLGGNIATNAGGLKLIKYGGAREQVLGLEVVLADGRILDLNDSLRKNNTGVDLKQLFIASEGTLGIITKACLKLQSIPNELILSCMTVDRFESIPSLISLYNKNRLAPTAFEFFSQDAMILVERFHPKLKNPFQNPSNYYVLLEFEAPAGAASPTNALESFVEQALEQGLVSDAVIASNSEQFKQLWGFRENISESVAQNGHVRKNDIALGIEQLKDFFIELNNLLSTQTDPDIKLIIFGHIGDGNLHINYIADKSMDKNLFHQKARAVEKKIFDILKRFRGSISAEHGIGLLKKEDLKFSKSQLQLSIMRSIKNMFDPNNILNPGKIID